MVKKFVVAAILVLSFVFVSMPLGAAYAAAPPKVFPAFSSQNIDGNPVTGDIFSGKKLTMINLWATWCPPCIYEMPDLGNLARSMPEGSQLVGIVLDVEGPNDSENIGDAKEIISDSNADFLQILPIEEMIPVLRWIEAIPTTIFVDSKGQIIGDFVIGMRDEDDYRTEVENRLKSM